MRRNVFSNRSFITKGLFDVQQWLVTLVLWYNQLGMNDVDRVGGKMPPWVK